MYGTRPLDFHLPQLFFVFMKLLCNLRVNLRRIRLRPAIHIRPCKCDPAAQFRTPNKGSITLLLEHTERLDVFCLPTGLLLQKLIVIDA